MHTPWSSFVHPSIFSFFIPGNERRVFCFWRWQGLLGSYSTKKVGWITRTGWALLSACMFMFASAQSRALKSYVSCYTCA
jgi:hypothetical protein